MDSRTTTDPWVGTRVHHRYRARRLVARSGDEARYEGTDEHMRQPVWLRVHSDPEGRDRQLAVAAALTRAQHPNLESVLAFGETGDGVYVVTERRAGHRLSDELAPGVPLSPNHAFAVLEPVVGALARAHGVRLAHGRLGPDAVVMTDDGRVEVEGFSMPEATSAQTRDDVLSCGALLHLLLTGQPRRPGSAAPSARVPHLPAYVDALVASMTAVDPALRPADAGELVPLVRAVSGALLDGLEQSPDLQARLASRREDDPLVDDADPGASLSPAVVERAARLRAEAAGAMPGGLPGPAVPAQDRRETMPGPAAADDAATKATGRPRLMWRVVLVALLSVAIAALWVVLRPREEAQPTATVVDPPEVVGMTVADARRTLQQSGLRVRLSDDRAFSDEVPVGDVVAVVLPEAPATGDTATLVVSRGPRRPQVPPLTGGTVPAARALLRASDLTVGSVIEVVGSDLAAGRIVGTIPAAGSRLAPGSVVALQVSNGQRSFEMPSFLGWRLFDARHAARRFSLAVIVSGTAADDDTVSSQSPAPGTLVEGGTTLTLFTRR